MKKLVFLLLVVVAVAGLLFWLVGDNQATVTLATSGYVMQFGLWTALGLLLITLLLVRLAYAALRALIAPGWRLMNNREQRRDRKILEQSRAGLVALAEGRWSAAQKVLLKTADKLDRKTALICYLGAAEACAKLGDSAEALEILRLAEEAEEANQLAVGLSRASLYSDQNRHEEALAQLQRLHRSSPNHPYVLAKLAQVYRVVGDWDALEKLLPDLLSNKVLDKAAGVDTQVQISVAQLNALSKATDSSKATKVKVLEELWARTKKPVRDAPQVLSEYVRALAAAGEMDTAEATLRRAINKRWDDDLVIQYGQLHGQDTMRQLVTAEGWLRERPNNANLLLTLGRLCKRNKLWGKSRDYLESSLSLANRPTTRAELAIVMANLGENKQSNQLFQSGLLETVGLDKDAVPNPGS